MHKPSGFSLLHDALQEVIQMKKKDMIVFVLSDFLATGYEKTLKMLSKRHETFAIVCFDKLEQSLPCLGLLTIQDPETSARIVISTSDKNVQIFLEKQHATVRDICSRAKVDMLHLQIEKPFIGDLIHFFKKQTF